VAIALIPVIPAALAYPHPVLDTLLVSAMCLHTHWLAYFGCFVTVMNDAFRVYTVYICNNLS